MKIKGKGLDKMINVQLKKYSVEVGILEDKNKTLPKYGAFYNYAGIKLLRRTTKASKESLVDVAKRLDEQFMWLRKPFLQKKNKELVEVIDFIVDDLNGKGNKQRILNAVQAVIRNPILRGDYGKNSRVTAIKKGFNKLGMATGQFFKEIKARFS